MTDHSYDTVIVGGGPAGLNAALMLGRARRRVLVLDGGEPRNRFADHMHGVLGQDGRDPGGFLEAARAEVRSYGVEFQRGRVSKVDRHEDHVVVQLAAAETVTARTLVVASGMADELPPVAGLAERWGSGVLHCPYCHGWEVRDGRLGVLTTSPMSLHQAQLVRQWSDDVVVFTAGLGRLDMAEEFRLRARGIRLVAAEVVEVGGDDRSVAWARTSDGQRRELDALFTAPKPRPRDDFLESVELTRSDTPFGSFIAVDETGRTSAPRIWAAGNVTNPGATVPVAMGAGAVVGGAINGFLVAEEFDRAVADRAGWPEIAPLDYWEHRYSGPERTWSGRVNPVLAEVAGGLPPGRALDLGCGEGADAVWLARHGWAVTGIDISTAAIEHARTAVEDAGVAASVTLRAGDLATLDDEARFDLVTASYLHSPVELPRAEILRRAAALVAPGGRLLVTSHVALPHLDDLPASLAPRFLSPAEEVAGLGLDPRGWDVEIAEVRPRPETGRGGHTEDSVVLARRRPSR